MAQGDDKSPHSRRLKISPGFQSRVMGTKHIISILQSYKQMKEINPEEYGNQQIFKLLQGGVAPRPIAFASTVDSSGNPNLSPFSFYNAFGINPTTLIFSPSRRGRDNSIKHTLENIREVPEVVLNAVTYSMVQQMSLSSTEYPKGINEFMKSGLTPVDAVKVRPFRVKESPLQFECRVRDIIETGGKPGSANLVICEIVYAHVDESILDSNGNILPDKIDLVGRMGGNSYVRTAGTLFEVSKPLTSLGIGVDSLPVTVRNSSVLSGNDLGLLGNQEVLPDREIQEEISLPAALQAAHDKDAIHAYAKRLIAEGKVEEALKLLLAFG